MNSTIMSKSNSVIESDWFGLYKEKWAGLIHPDAIAHPAKFARALIRQIYQHAVDEQWLQTGDHVLDCFGGVSLGAHDAMRHGLHWTGCELESKFVELGNQNITLWNDSYADKMPVWGSARLTQGDSRKLSEVLAQVSEGLISSPPYVNKQMGGGGQKHDTVIDAMKAGYGTTAGKLANLREGSADLSRSSPPFSPPGNQPNKVNGGSQGVRASYPDGQSPDEGYSESLDNLGNLRMIDSDLAAVIASPPYANDTVNDRNGIDISLIKSRYGKNSQAVKMSGYSSEPLNLGNLPTGDVAAVIASPPFVESLASDEPEKRGGLFRDAKRANDKTLTATYGTSDGQLGAMKEGAAAVVSSPPYEGIKGHPSIGSASREDWNRDGGDIAKRRGVSGNYGESQGQLQASTGETFWSASRLILEQCHQVLAPGAHAIFVVKGFVRKKQYVDFPAQWAALCEAVGFKLLHWHRSWLIEPKGIQRRLDGGEDDLSIQRKSFFRLLAERKGSPKIDFEVVLCFERL